MKNIFGIILFLMPACSMRSNSEKIVQLDESIILINIEQLKENREKISQGIFLLSAMEPKVVAINFQFTEESDSKRVDSILMNALSNCGEKLVLSSNIENYDEVLEEYSRFENGTISRLIPRLAKTGFSSLASEFDLFDTIKKFSLSEKVNGKIEYQFGVQAAMLFDSVKANKFIKQHPKVNDIDFHGGRKFKSLNLVDFLCGKILPSEIKGKIVILGLLGPGFTDRYYSAAIQRGNGSFEPDMYSTEIQAHIVLQVLAK